MAAPTIRTDLVEVYVFRADGQAHLCHDASVTFLQMQRAQNPMKATWQPVMGHVRSQQDGVDDETATEAALRELAQETGYRHTAGLIGFWQLETVSPYFMASQNCVMMSPCFAAQVATTVDPMLNHEHDAFRWVGRDLVDRMFIWPGQRVAIDQIVRDILPDVWTADATPKSDQTAAQLLRINLAGQALPD